MTTTRLAAFDLPTRLRPKADPALIGQDEELFAALGAALDEQIAEATDRLAAARRVPDDHDSNSVDAAGQAAMDRDTEVRRLAARLRLLRRFGIDLCLGRMTPADGGDPIYIGRMGLTDSAGRRLLVDWRAPASEPFFAATPAHAMGLATRRRYRWTNRRITDYWDEVLDERALESGSIGAADGAALDDQSAFIASLGGSRSPQMRDVLSTIQADQDAIIRADSHGPLVVDGGPGTGKTVVALHRAAYLLYSEPRIVSGGGGVLFVGPHQAYLDYVDDVLPSLGEDSVRICTLRDLVPEGAAAVEERDGRVARLKASLDPTALLDAAVRHYERPPRDGLVVQTPWADVELDVRAWAEAFDAPEPGTPHNEARAIVWDALLEIAVDRIAAETEEADDETVDDAAPHLVRRYLAQDDDVSGAFARAWPLLDPAGVVKDLWSVPAYLAQCAPHLSGDEVLELQRADARAFTVADLPILDAARHRIGDPEAVRRARRRAAALAAEREQRARVTEDLIASDDSEMLIMRMLTGQDFENSLVDESSLSSDATERAGVTDASRATGNGSHAGAGARAIAEAEALAGPFAHVIVDEAQELTDAEWQMLLRRCPSRSLTIVGDRAQARRGFSGTWAERLGRIGLGGVRQASLTVNYRTPREVMAVAEPVIRAALADANVPTSIRSSGIPVQHGSVSDLEAIVADWLTEHGEGVACVIGAPEFAERPRVRSLTPVTAKGLEFDLVVIVDPQRFGADEDVVGQSVGGPSVGGQSVGGQSAGVDGGGVDGAGVEVVDGKGVGDGGIEGAVDRYVAMTRSTQRLVILT